MTTLYISPIYILLNIMLILVLAYRVVTLRRRYKVGLGDGNHKELRMAIATHANAIENMPIALIVLLIAELNGGTDWVLHAGGMLLTVARIWHAMGTLRHVGTSTGRYYGTVITWMYSVAMGFYAVLLPFI